MIISVPKETANYEHRVALVPESVSKLTKKGFEVWVESGAGSASGFLDERYVAAGATIVTRKEVFEKTDLLAVVQFPDQKELATLPKGAGVAGFMWALQHQSLVEFCQKQQLTTLSMDAVPRITRAQKMDALSSMSSIAGYKAVLMASSSLGKYLPMMMTAAGTIPPAKALILGAGVAGLQAIATARRLGAVVEAFDVRSAVKEQVESLGASFVEVPLEEADTETKGGYAKELSKDSQDRQRQVIHEHCKKSDMVITTALIPGKKAPLLITKEMVKDMQPGSVVVDLAAEQGGNCEVTTPGETTIVDDVVIVGPINVPSTMPLHASLLYSRNLFALLELALKDGTYSADFDDEIILKSTITHAGEVVSPMLKGDL